MGSQPTKDEHSIPRKAAGEARRQEPPGIRKPEAIKSRQLWGKKRMRGQKAHAGEQRPQHSALWSGAGVEETQELQGQRKRGRS